MFNQTSYINKNSYKHMNYKQNIAKEILGLNKFLGKSSNDIRINFKTHIQNPEEKTWGSVNNKGEILLKYN